MVYYVSFFAQDDNIENRNIVLSATNKMKYILNTFKCNKINAEVVSCSWTCDKKGYKGACIKLNECIKFRQFRTYGNINLLTKLLDYFSIKLRLFFYLLINVSKKDTVLVYHSLYYCDVVKIIRFIKKCRLILEVEELYSDVSGNARQKKKELSVCNSADAFIFPTDMLNTAVNKNNKPYVVIHGTYQVEPDIRVKFNDGKIHVVYAGTFDPRKGGAAAAVCAAEFLDERYHIHILGFGSENDKNHILSEIERVNKISKCTVSFDGLLSGEDYIKFIQGCDIGLSTQNPDADFNATSFPSKILSYMANGLRVVSVRIPAIENSSIGDYMYYYDKQTPEEIAKAIKSVDMNDEYNGRSIISELDNKFSNDIVKLLD